MVARVYFDRFVNKSARPYILFMSKAIDQSLFAFYCTKPILFSDRPPESNQARLAYALQLSQHFRPRLTTRMVITGKRAPSVLFPWSLAVHHQSLAFRACLCQEKNEAPEEEAGHLAITGSLPCPWEKKALTFSFNSARF